MGQKPLGIAPADSATAALMREVEHARRGDECPQPGWAERRIDRTVAMRLITLAAARRDVDAARTRLTERVREALDAGLLSKSSAARAAGTSRALLYTWLAR